MSRKPDDLDLWNRLAETVTPIRHRGRRPKNVVLPKTSAAAPKPSRIKTPAAPALPMPVPPPLATPGPTATKPTVDRRTARKLKRGDVSIDARIDLHGSTQAEAHRRLERFLHDAHASGLRLVLVITGKGFRDGEPGVLRASVPRWLGEAPNRHRVLGFTNAAPKDGGDGALYVRLRRRA
jgi:DNA-nicking Smr family endonuclease